MNLKTYRQFTQQLISNLANDEAVLGLVAAGSMAEQDYKPDEWSDHDFYVIVQSGKQDHYRDNHNWLPDFQDIVWSFRETAHGVKILYQNGHLLEYAVFDEEELNLAKSNRYRVLLDRSTIKAQMTRIKAETNVWATETNDTVHLGQFLTNLLVGMGRYKRGELLSAHRFVKANALHHLTALINRHVSSPQQTLSDNIDPTRRFDFVYPTLGQELQQLLLQDIPQAAQGMLTLFEREIGHHTINIPTEVFNIIRNLLVL